jgi:outer membrane lipoprotein-sorting protein
MKKFIVTFMILLVLSGCSLTGNPTTAPANQAVSPVIEHATPTPIPPPELSGALEIQQLMLQSHTHWKSLQANAIASLYPPAGMNGETQNTSVQVWIEQPGKARVIAGPPDLAPTHIFLSDGQNTRNDSDPPSPLPPSVLDTFNAPTALTDTVTPHPLSGYLGTSVSDLIFPTGLAQRGGEYRLIGKESFANREVYLVEWGREPGQLIDRFWVDTQTGVILRHQSYGKQDSVTPVSDVRLTSIQFDQDLPDDLFRLDDPALPALATPMPTLDPGTPQLTIRPDLTQVNVRGGPSTTYPVLGGLYPKQVVPVVGKNEAGDWWAVDLEGQTGWVLAELVEFSGDPAAIPVLPAP